MSAASRLLTEDDTPIAIDAFPFDLGRRLLGPEFAFVSRLQATLSLDNTGGVILESKAEKNATGVRPAGSADWTWVQRGQTKSLANGDKIALDRKCKPGTILLLEHQPEADVHRHLQHHLLVLDVLDRSARRAGWRLPRLRRQLRGAQRRPRSLR